MGACIKLFKSKIKVGAAIKKLDQVSKLLDSMASRYKSEINAIDINTKTMTKQQILVKLRRKKMIEKSLTDTENKLSILFQKRLLLESLDVTKMQIKALKNSTKVLKGFTSINNVEKIEELTDNLEEMMGNVIEINDILNEDNSNMDIDENELLEEVEEMMAMNYELPLPPTNNLKLKKQLAI